MNTLELDAFMASNLLSGAISVKGVNVLITKQVVGHDFALYGMHKELRNFIQSAKINYDIVIHQVKDPNERLWLTKEGFKPLGSLCEKRFHRKHEA